ncbi:MAG TPA: sugar MFS transporter [Terriglobales bacterium]|nr:sugar MFS transporter [Terriglobales bacterium]
MNTYTSDSTTSSTAGARGSGLFRTTDGRDLTVVFALITSLFLLWGFCNGMIDILNKHFQDTLHINKEQSGLVQAANYLAYFLMAIPAGLIAKRFGYKGGILVGLSLIAAGAFWFIPATNIGTYWAFLLGLFVIAAGMTCLETIANPYATVLGAPEGGPTRINIAQTINGLGWILGPIVGGHFVFAGGEHVNSNAGLSTPYMGIGIFVLLLLMVFVVAKIPDLHVKDENLKPSIPEKLAKVPGAPLGSIAIVLAAVCGVLYFFIAPILEVIWALLNMSEAFFQPVKYGLLIVAYVAAFLLVSRNWDMFRRKHFTLGIAAQFLYVAAQTGIFSFCVNYILENDPGVTRLEASKWLGAIGFGLFMVGRLCGSAVISQFRPHRVLAAYSLVNVALVAVTMGGGKIGLYAMFATFFFMSVGFPTIFALAIRGLGEHTKLGSSLIVMSIVGGAIAAPFMGHIADRYSMRAGFVVPLVCFVFIALYGIVWAKICTLDTSQI